MDRKIFCRFAVVLALTVALAVAPTVLLPSQDPGSPRVTINPSGLTNSGSGRMLIDPDGRV